MQVEENLGRCEVCGFISQESNVRRHIREVHQSPVEMFELNEDEDHFEDYSQCEEFPQEYTTSKNNEVEVETDIGHEEENLGTGQSLETSKSYDKLHWSTPQVQLLIQLFDKNKLKFEDKKTRNKTIWKSIADEIAAISKLNVTIEQCENKFKNLRKTYKKVVDNNSSTGRGAKNWPFFKDMDSIFSKDPDIRPISLCSNIAGPSTSTPVAEGNLSTSNLNVQDTNTRPMKRKKPSKDEPEWLKKFREDCQHRHEEKMKRQDSLLKILEKLVEK